MRPPATGMRFFRAALATCIATIVAALGCGGSTPVAPAPNAALVPPLAAVSAAPAAPPPPTVVRREEQWQAVCVAAPDSPAKNNECDIKTLTRLSDDAFFFAGGYYGSARIGGHTLKQQAFRTAFLGVIDGSGKVKWVKSAGTSWHNELSSAVALDAHRVMLSGVHANGFDASLPPRKVRPVTRNGVAQDMGFHAEEVFVGVWNDEGKLEWAKNLVDLLGVPWSEDDRASGCMLESDGAGGALCTATAGTTRYRLRIDGKGTPAILERSAVELPSDAVRYPQPPPAPPGRTFSHVQHVTTPSLGTWMLYEDHRKPPLDPAGFARVWAEDVHHVLWRWSPGAAWAFAIGDGESRGTEGLFVGKDGVAYVTAPSVRVTSTHPPFTEVSLLRVDPDGRIAWRRPLWALTLPPSPVNRVEIKALAPDPSGDMVMHIAYSTPIAVGGVALPLPIADAKSMQADIVVAAATGAVARVEWLDARRNCFFDYALQSGAPEPVSAGDDRVVAGNAFGSWNTAACGAVRGAPSVIARFKKAM